MVGWWDGGTRTALAVSEVVWDHQFPFRANRHQGQRFDPAWDHAAYRKLSWLATLYGAVEHAAVDQFTGIMDAYAVLTG